MLSLQSAGSHGKQILVNPVAESQKAVASNDHNAHITPLIGRTKGTAFSSHTQGGKSMLSIEDGRFQRAHFSSCCRGAAAVCLAHLILGLVGCGGSNQSSTDPPTASIAASAGDSAAVTRAATANAAPAISKSASSPAEEKEEDLFPEVVIKTSVGDIQVRLNAEKAPRTVDNFLENYVNRGFYEGTTFHYVEKDFMVIAGGFTADRQAKETRAPISNESHNGLKNVRGTVAMARHADYRDSATSQFFINLVDNPSLDFVEAEDEEGEDIDGYCVFGEVTQGMDVIDRVAATPVHDQDGFPNTPKTPIVIQAIERSP
jgi:cyclophilin family peptidyl-prolyl cis-trans isomerase